jgi:hypothetical protein
MAARGFLKEVDVNNFNEPLYVGADEKGRLARVAMKDIVIRGKKELFDFSIERERETNPTGPVPVVN